MFREEVPELLDADPKLLFKLCTMITPKVRPHFTAVERTWHTSDSQDQIVALIFQARLHEEVPEVFTRRCSSNVAPRSYPRCNPAHPTPRLVNRRGILFLLFVTLDTVPVQAEVTWCNMKASTFRHANQNIEEDKHCDRVAKKDW